MTIFKYDDKEKYSCQEGWVKRTIDYIFLATNDYFKQFGCVVEACMDPDDIDKMGMLNK